MSHWKHVISLSVGVLVTLGASFVAPAVAQEFSEEEAAALEYNLDALCNASFEDLADMGIEFNETGEEYLNVACDAVMDGIDENDFSDDEFNAAIDFLAEALAAVTYE